jgi:hypothetical protein
MFSLPERDLIKMKLQIPSLFRISYYFLNKYRVNFIWYCKVSNYLRSNYFILQKVWENRVFVLH